jgi:glutamine synthetase
LYPGTGFEAHVDAIINGGELLGYKAEKKLAEPKAKAAMGAPCGVEDRNRTAPFPFCGNRFEFRAVGSSQNCSFPIAIVNTVMASGMATLASLIESGKSHRDAVAQMYKDNRSIIFTGNGYSAEWPVEAAKRGLPNLNTTPLALPTFNSAKAKKVFNEMGVFADDETDARQEVMYENYNTVLSIEVETMIQMVETGILPACAQDMAAFAAMPKLAGDRVKTYADIMTETNKLKEVFAGKPHDLAKEAEYLCNSVKPQMVKVREAVDKAEGLMQKALYPYPTYEDIIYSHHS